MFTNIIRKFFQMLERNIQLIIFILVFGTVFMFTQEKIKRDVQLKEEEQMLIDKQFLPDIEMKLIEKFRDKSNNFCRQYFNENMNLTLDVCINKHGDRYVK